MTEALATPLSQLFRTDSLHKYAPRPGLGFRTGITDTLVYPGSTENQSIAVAADGSVWTLTSSSVSQYSVGQGSLVKICDYKLYNPHMFGFPQHLAPVSSRQAYFIQSRNNQPVISAYVKDQDVVDLQPLPDSDSPSQISAAADGSLWVLGRSGAAWNYQSASTGSKWTKVAADTGTTLQQVSVGSAGFVLALGQVGGVSRVLRLSDGRWIAHNTLVHAGVSWIAACEGGEYWWSSGGLQGPGELQLIQSEVKILGFPLEQGSLGFAAATRRSCYFFSLPRNGFCRAALGVIDQADTTWPTMNAGEKKAYSEISTRLGVIDEKGVRSQYTNINASFSIWYSRIGEMTRPTDIAEADWNSVKEQLKDELEYVQSVTTLSTNMGLLNACIGQIYTNTYNQVVTLLRLPDKPADMPKNPVEVVLNMLMGKLQGELISKAKSMIGSEVIDIGMACYKFGIDQLTKEHHLPDGNTPLIIASSELAGVLAKMTVESEKGRGEFQQKILSDWGRLSACGEAIRSGAWYWGPNTNYETIKGAGAAIQLNFYQTLMPVKWKIVLCQGILSINPPLSPYMPYVPRYSLMFQYMSNGSTTSMYWWAACMEVSAQEGQRSEGPFPDPKILETVFGLGTTPLDFFAGRNGWKLPRVPVSGYTPPPGDVPWRPYENSSAPFK